MAEIFKRYEKKYLLDEDQYSRMLELIKEYMIPDKFYQTRVNSIYYDTANFQLIRRSIEKPQYKEKLRIRTYGEINDDDNVFVELKKKYDGIVYKRRTKARYIDVIDDIYSCSFKDKQIGDEIRYALNYYDRLKPAFFISCMRTSFIGKEDDGLRITFDNDVLYRCKNLSLRNTADDQIITDKTIMELKVAGAMPIWLCKALDETKAYPRGFSKVGTAFIKKIEGEKNE